MKSKLEYLVKHNKILQKLFTFFGSLFLKFLGLFVKTDEKMILFSSFMGKSYNDSPRCIYEFLLNHNEYGFKFVWAFEEPEKFSNLGCIVVKIDTLKYFLYALKAKYWVTCVNIERGLHFKKKKTVYINTWHGIAIKKIGNDCGTRKDYDFSKINYFCVSSEYDEKIFASAFNTSKSNYLECGMPRNDELYEFKDNSEYIKSLKIKLNLPLDKKIILYAPTWRESNDLGKSYKIQVPVDFKNWENELGKDYIVLFRAHVKTTEIMNIEFNDFIKDFSKYDLINDLLLVSDLLISDYSAISFDYSILCKPIICFAFDYDSYLLERGVYIDPKELFKDNFVNTETELIDRIKLINSNVEDEITKQIKEVYLQYGANATKICSEIILKDFNRSNV